MKRITILLLVVLTVMGIGCVNSEENEFEDINSWIKESMEENYLWNERVPDKVDGSIPPNAFFGSMLDPNDYFSYIVSSKTLVEDNSFGRTFTSGLSPSFGRFNNSSGVFAIAEYVYPNSSADTAGLKRGDIILAIDGTPLNTSNYLNLFYAEKSTIRYSLGAFDLASNTIDETGETISVEQREIEFNPIVYTDIISEGNNKIGYLFYSMFLSGENDKYNDSLDIAMQNMIAEGVTDLVVDLRYNTGGDMDAAENLANSLVSSSAAQSEEVFVRFRYNDIVQQRIIEEEGADSERLVLKFSSDPENLGLQNIYFLTSNKTSTTSELLINGLTPHMNVNTIGEATNGQFFGSTVITGETATPPNEFAIVPINLQYENSEGTTNLVLGIQPDSPVEDDLLIPYELGDINDPVLKEALSLITGNGSAASKISAKKYESLEDVKAKRRGSILFNRD